MIRDPYYGKISPLRWLTGVARESILMGMDFYKTTKKVMNNG